jgi:hypothetical protein
LSSTTAEGIPPTFIQKPIIKQEQDGKRLIFECKLSAEPRPDLIWTHDDKPIGDSARYLISCDPLPNNAYVACLAIDGVIASDGGKYKVTARNTLGESNAHIGLNLDSKCYSIDRVHHLFLYKHRMIVECHRHTRQVSIDR